MHPYITLILPAYNEAGRIANTIEEARTYFRQRGHSHQIIVAADGGDGTRELVAKMAAHDPALQVIGSPERRGKGFGIRQAVTLARGEIIGFADADNKTPIEEFDKIEPLLSQGYEVVIGSRALRQSRIEHAQPWYRRIGSRGFGLVMHALVGLDDIVDTQCGFKFFQRRVAHFLFERQKINGYMFDVEILYLAQQAKFRIGQVPIRWRDDGDSRLALFSGNIQNAFDLLNIRFNSGRHQHLLPAPDQVTVRSR